MPSGMGVFKRERFSDNAKNDAKKRGSLSATPFPGILSFPLCVPLRLKSSRLKSIYAPFHLLSRVPVRVTHPCVNPFPFILSIPSILHVGASS